MKVCIEGIFRESEPAKFSVTQRNSWNQQGDTDLMNNMGNIELGFKGQVIAVVAEIIQLFYVYHVALISSVCLNKYAPLYFATLQAIIQLRSVVGTLVI